MPLRVGVLPWAKAEQEENELGVSRIYLVCLQVGQSAIGSGHIFTILGIFSFFLTEMKTYLSLQPWRCDVWAAEEVRDPEPQRTKLCEMNTTSSFSLSMLS